MEISEYISIEELNRIYEQLEELPDYLLDDLDSFISWVWKSGRNWWSIKTTSFCIPAVKR